MEYSAVAFHKKYEGGKKGGKLSLDRLHLIFSNENDIVRVPISSVTLERGGAANALIYFKSSSFPDWIFYTSDKTILKEPEWLNNQQTKAFVSKIKSNKIINYAIVFSIIGLVIASFASLYVFKGVLVKYMASKIPVSYEKEMGDKMFPLAVGGKKIIEDSLLNSYLDVITIPLQASVNDSNFKFKYYIVEASELNAFALPGGHVVIHSGLILSADSYEELAGVLAHELSHVTLRHHARGLINNLGVMALLGGIVGDGGDLFATVLYGGAQLSLLKHSRDLEEESDKQGWEYLLKAGINPQGMISFFQKLEKEHEADSLVKEAETMMSFMSTHPETAARIKVLEQKLAATENMQFTPIKEDFELFKEKLKSKL